LMHRGSVAPFPQVAGMIRFVAGRRGMGEIGARLRGLTLPDGRDGCIERNGSRSLAEETSGGA
jgi:hypothetical protein